MKNLISSMRRYGIGGRPQTLDDFYCICEAENIEVIHTGKIPFYFTMQGQKFINLPKRRKGLRQLREAFHELGHALISAGDAPEAAFFIGHTKDEAEADAIALVALIPKSEALTNPFLDDSRYASHLANERLKLLFLYDI